MSKDVTLDADVAVRHAALLAALPERLRFAGHRAEGPSDGSPRVATWANASYDLRRATRSTDSVPRSLDLRAVEAPPQGTSTGHRHCVDADTFPGGLFPDRQATA